MSLFKPPTPVIISSGGGGGSGTAIINGSSSIAVNVDPITNISSIAFTTKNRSAMSIDDNQQVVIGDRTGIIPMQRLTISDRNGQGIELINSSTQNKLSSSLTTNAQGSLVISTSGSIVQLTSNKVLFDLGSITIGGVMLTSTADQLNYNMATPGVVSGLRTFVADENRNIRNINSLTAASLTGTIITANQPNITTLNEVSISRLSINGVTVQASANEINYNTGASPGTAMALKTVVLDANKNINGLNILRAATLVGTILTSDQPNITNIGTLEQLLVRQRIGIGTNNPTRVLEIVGDAPSIRLSNRTHVTDFFIDNSGNLRIHPDNDIVINSNKNMVFSGSSMITGLNRLSANTLSGTITTPSQPQITTIGTLTTLTVNQDVVIGSYATDVSDSILTIREKTGHCLRLERTEVFGCELNVNNVGDLEIIASKNVRIPGGKELHLTGPLIGVTTFAATNITGTLTAGPQPNITAVGTLASLTVSNNIQADTISATSLSGVVQTANQPNITAIGTLSSLTVTNTIRAGGISAEALTGTLQTSAQPNITEIGRLTTLTVTQDITARNVQANGLGGLLLNGIQPSITQVGTLTNLNVSDTVNAQRVVANTLSGMLQTSAQPNITSVGNLNSLTVLNDILCSNVIAYELTGVLQTRQQPNIISLGTLTSLRVTNAINAGSIITETLSGIITTSSQPNITSIGTLQRLNTNGSIGIQVANPVSVIDINTNGLSVDPSIRLTNGQTNISFGIGTNGAIINTNRSFLDIGMGVSLRFLGGGIVGLAQIASTQITGTLQTASQLAITEVGTLNYLNANFVGIGINSSSQYRVNIQSNTGHIALISDGSRTMNISVANNDYTITTSTQRFALGSNVSLVFNGGTIIGLDTLTANSIQGTITTANQPNITRIGTLSSLSVSGAVTADSGLFGSLSINGDVTINGNLNLQTPLSISNISGRNAVFDSDVAATSPTNGGTLTVIGGAAFSRNVIIGTSLTIGNVTLTESSFMDTENGIPGTVEADKTIVADSHKDLIGFRNLTSENLYGTISTSYQPNITTIGNLTDLNVNGYLGVGTSAPMKKLEVNSVTGECLRLSFNKALVSNAFMDITVDESGNGSILSNGGSLTLPNITRGSVITLGNTNHNMMPLEIGFVPFTMTEPYAFNTSAGGRGIIRPTILTATSYNYSIRALGRILCTQSLDVMSDKRTKKNIKELTDEYCTAFIERTTPISFNWIEGDASKSFGYIAQELIRSGFDDLVNLTHDPSVEEVIDDDGFVNPAGVKFTISYQHIIPILAKNQKRLIQENAELRAKLDAILELLQHK